MKNIKSQIEKNIDSTLEKESIHNNFFKLIGIYVENLDNEDPEVKQKLSPSRTDIKYINFKKKLKSGYFPIDNELSYLQYEKDVLKFTNNSECFDIFSFSKNLKININAIVGKNGSGKSTLLEIIYLMVYNLSINKGILNPTYPTKECAKAHYMPYLKASMIYKANNGEYCSIKFNIVDCSTIDQNSNNKNKIIFTKGVEDENGYIIFGNEQNNDFDINDFVYSIALNYSIFGLNNEILGDWVQQLFHKNDGYQTPIVLNPYKESGEYSVNNEIALSRDRILTNVMLTYESKKDFILIDDYVLNKIQFTMSPEVPKVKSKGSFEILIKPYINTAPTNFFYKTTPIDLYFEPKNKNEKFNVSKELFTFTEFYLFLSSFINDKNVEIINKKLEIDLILKNSIGNEHEKIINELVSYLYYKLVKIWITYYNILDEIIIYGDGIKHNLNFENLLSKVIDDRSHKTLKFRRCLNFLNNIDKYKALFINENNEIRIDIDPDNFYSICSKIKKESPNLTLDELLLPGCFKLDFTFNNNIELSSLSSGELQKILSVQTVFYHLLNLNSVPNSSKRDKLIKYKNVLVIFDEIELYFHPEYQRTFIKSLIDLLQYFSSILMDIQTIQILFATHSPFILSDIPSQNVLKLKEGNPELNVDINSFAANIYDLLNDEFFLKNGAVGAYAQNYINTIIYNIEKINPDTDKKIINELKNKIAIIGDELIRYGLEEHLFERLKSPEFEIELLKERIKNLEAKNVNDEKN